MIPAKLVILVTMLAISSPLSGAIIITISPVQGQPSQFQVMATGTGDVTSVPASFGNLNLDFDAFQNSTSSLQAGLFFGGAEVQSAEGFDADTYEVGVDSPLAIGNMYSFSGGPVIGEVVMGQTFDSTFITGSYLITGGDGIFGDNPTGQLIISDVPVVPEPSTSLLIVLSAACFLAKRSR